MPPTPKLITEINAPLFEDAACQGLWELFDEDHSDQHHSAVYICKTCPVLRACHHWVEHLPPTRRPAGVVAGHAYYRRASGHVTARRRVKRARVRRKST